MNLSDLPMSPSWNTDVIPKVIHQTAPADINRWHPLWPLCQRTWKEKFPEYEYKFWSDEDIDTFIRTRFPSFYPSFIGFRYQIHRADAFRYFLLYELGGIYADMDYECLSHSETFCPRGR